MKLIRTAVKSVATAVALVGMASVAEAQGTAPSANRGKILFLHCVACHDLKPGTAPPPPAPGASAPPLKIGPHLGDIIGRKAGIVPAPALSSQLKASNIVWTEDVLDKWIEKPGSVVPGTTMAFGGVPKPEDRQSIILYLKRETASGGGAN
ncbi:MAG: cytochrome c family protein [Gammaproteobacteria bacterium]|nr:cytochrome c family protein [Gammaproteobacteria bacterium]